MKTEARLLSCRRKQDEEARRENRLLRKLARAKKITIASRRGVLSCLFLVSCFWLRAADVSFEWDPNTEPEVNRYEFRVRNATTNTVTINGRTNVTHTASLTGTNIVDVRAVTTNGLRSDWSDELRVVIPEKPVLRLKLTLSTAMDPAGPWQGETNEITLVADANRKFFRTSLTVER